jgi:hypothetical protein
VKKTYETVDAIHRGGAPVPVGTRLVLHDHEAKYLGHALREIPQAEPQRAIVRHLRRRAQGA